MSKTKKKDTGKFSLVWLVSIPVLVFISILIFLLLWDGFERKVVDISVNLPKQSGIDIDIDMQDILDPLTAEDYANILGD